MSKPVDNIRIEKWESDKGSEEIHHFLYPETTTYLFGFNRQLLGEEAYQIVLEFVRLRLERMKSEKESKVDSETLPRHTLD